MSTTTRVARLVTWCDVDDRTWRMRAAGRLSKNMDFDVHDLAVLDDGHQLSLRRVRSWGFGLGVMGDDTASRDPWDYLTQDWVVRDTFIALLPETLEDDAEAGDALPYTELAGLITAQGVEVSRDELRALPYDVELGPHLRDHLDRGSTPTSTP